MKSFEFDAAQDGSRVPSAYLNDARAGITQPYLIEERNEGNAALLSKGPRTVADVLTGRARRRFFGQRVAVDLDSCKRKYSHGRRGARAAARELRRMATGDVLDLDRAKVLIARLEPIPRG